MKRTAIAVLLILIFLVVVVGYYVFQPRNSARIMIDGVVLNVDLATTQAEQEKGLSGRASMPPDHGMLFIFQNEDYWSFWMYEMKFPLDMIWFNSSRQAVFFEQSLPPCSPVVCPVFTPSSKAMYVLEVNAGFVAAHKISLSDMFTFVVFTSPMGVGSGI
ncbi:MAG: DUF192 domain-containing protein [Candidatus Bathyarchaeia archaeon]